MKKLLTVLLAAGLVLALTLPASAFDSEFGGFWRTRALHPEEFHGGRQRDPGPDQGGYTDEAVLHGDFQ